MTIQDDGEYRKLFLNRRKTNQFDHTVVRKAIFTWCRLTTVIVSKRILRFSKSMTSTMFFSCPTFQNASWRTLVAKLWQQPTIFCTSLLPFCLFTLVRAIFIRHPMEPWDKGWSATLSRLAYKIARCVAGLKYTATKDFNYQLTVRCSLILGNNYNFQYLYVNSQIKVSIAAIMTPLESLLRRLESFSLSQNDELAF